MRPVARVIRAYHCVAPLIPRKVRKPEERDSEHEEPEEQRDNEEERVDLALLLERDIRAALIEAAIQFIIQLPQAVLAARVEAVLPTGEVAVRLRVGIGRVHHAARFAGRA